MYSNSAPWLGAQRKEEKWDAWLARRPRCADCREPITGEKCLPVEGGGVICEECIRFRMVEVEGV